jgi:hypothetical protein
MRILSLAAVVALTGCAMGQWHHPTATAAQFDQDQYECQMRANAMVPVNMTKTAIGAPPPTTTNCTAFGNQLNCTSRQASSMPITQYDQNQIPRARVRDQCLAARGYVFR